MEAYRRIIDITIEYDNKEVAERETLVFNEYIDKFRHFYQDDFMEEEPQFEDPDMIDSVPLTDTLETEDSTTVAEDQTE